MGPVQLDEGDALPGRPLEAAAEMGEERSTVLHAYVVRLVGAEEPPDRSQGFARARGVATQPYRGIGNEPLQGHGVHRTSRVTRPSQVTPDPRADCARGGDRRPGPGAGWH